MACIIAVLKITPCKYELRQKERDQKTDRGSIFPFTILFKLILDLDERYLNFDLNCCVHICISWAPELLCAHLAQMGI